MFSQFFTFFSKFIERMIRFFEVKKSFKIFLRKWKYCHFKGLIFFLTKISMSFWDVFPMQYLQDRGKGLRSIGSCPLRPLRIEVDYSVFDSDVNNPAMQSYVKDILIRRATNWFSSTLKVGRRLQISFFMLPCKVCDSGISVLYYGQKACTSQWSDGRCASASSTNPYSDFPCGFHSVDFAWLRDIRICLTSGSGDPCTTTTGGTGYTTTSDVVVFVSQRNTGCSSGMLAYASSCAQDASTGRPVFGFINICNEFLVFGLIICSLLTALQVNRPRASEYLIEQDVTTIIHEVRGPILPPQIHHTTNSDDAPFGIFARALLFLARHLWEPILWRPVDKHPVQFSRGQKCSAHLHTQRPRSCPSSFCMFFSRGG